jgi:hypothetical protein
LEVAVEFTIIGSLLQITVKREKEHEAASFGLIASFSQKRSFSGIKTTALALRDAARCLQTASQHIHGIRINSVPIFFMAI